MSKTSLLQSKYNLHSAPEVKFRTDQLRARGEKVPNSPELTIAAYLGNLAASHALLNRDVTQSEQRIHRQVTARIIKPENIPNSSIERIQNNADQPLGREAVIAAIRNDQYTSLREWTDYLSDPELIYPAWFKWYTYRNVFQMARYDAEYKKFNKRTQHTVAPYPELNQEALNLTYCDVTTLGQENKGFASIYAEKLELASSQQYEGAGIAGEWRTYSKARGPQEARDLSVSLRGYNTTWCTAASPETAASQLAGGNFYVYYSYDSSGAPSIPRLAIRTVHDTIAEVRGVKRRQSIDEPFYDIARSKLESLPGGEPYANKIAIEQGNLLNLPQLNILNESPNVELVHEQLMILYAVDQPNDDLQQDIEDRRTIDHSIYLETQLNRQSTSLETLRQKRNLLEEDLAILFPEADSEEILVRAHSSQYEQAFFSDKARRYDESLLLKLAEYGERRACIIAGRHLYRFSELGNLSVDILTRNGIDIQHNLKSFRALNPDYAYLFSAPDVILSDINVFSGSSGAVLRDLKTLPDHVIQTIARRLQAAPDMHYGIESAQRLIDCGRGNLVARNFDKFCGIDTKSGSGAARIASLRRGKKRNIQLVPIPASRAMAELITTHA